MAGGGGSKKSSNPTKARKRVEAENTASAASLVRARDGSAFARCVLLMELIMHIWCSWKFLSEVCTKDVPAALISMHNCSLDAKIKMNLEAQVVENPTEVKKTTKKNASEKNSGETGEPKPKRAKKEKGDPNKPKRPPTAYFIFMADFRKEYKEANPDCKEAKQVVKDAGAKWSSMTEEEKKPYNEKAAQLKADFAKGMDAETKETNSGDDENADESNKDEADESNKEDADEESNKEDAEDSKKEDPKAESEDVSGPE
ncbi:High mobility group B protein 7 [Linum grandiflorum]